MATITQKIDDLDGTPDARTITFAVDGSTFEIDLSETNIDGLKTLLAEYTTAARRIGAPAGLARKRRRKGGPEARERAAVREWAVSQGMMSPDARGRIPGSVLSAYAEAHHAGTI